VGGIRTLEGIRTRRSRARVPSRVAVLHPAHHSEHGGRPGGAPVRRAGPNFATTSACASGAHALGEALRLVRHGVQDVMIAGGTERRSAMLGVGGFAAMRALAPAGTTIPSARAAFRPRSRRLRHREGAGVLVLESLEPRDRPLCCAARRVRRLRLELRRVSRDAAVSGSSGLPRACRRARRRRRRPDAIDYVNATAPARRTTTRPRRRP
jgi:3-oxoacyl-[acyl-carrier-protein] synthase II